MSEAQPSVPPIAVLIENHRNQLAHVTAQMFEHQEHIDKLRVRRSELQGIVAALETATQSFKAQDDPAPAANETKQ